MQLVFLGTGSQYPAKHRGVSCSALRLDDGSIWLFDCGEGTQLQLQKSNLKPGKITKIFITHLHGDHLFGLPGLLCSIGSWNPDKRDLLEIYGPVGLRKYIRTCLQTSFCLLEYKFVVHELEILQIQIPEYWQNWPIGASNAETCMPQEQQGSNIKPNGHNIWHLFQDSKVSVIAGWVHHRVPCFGYVVQEEDLPGKLDVMKLQEFGIPPGPLYNKLKLGENVVTADGKTIESNTVVGPKRPGRKVAILGDTCDPSPMTEAIMNSDVLVHEATLENSLRENALENGHSTPEMAAKFATLIGARILMLTHYSQRYGLYDSEEDDTKNLVDKKSVRILLEEALQVVSSDCQVFLAEDLKEFNIPHRDL